MDPIVLNVLWSRLISTVNEQAAALMRSSFSSIVREAGDLAAGVFDRRGRMVAQATTGTPGHINPMATCMHHFLARFPLEELAPGDVLITNDPWKTASQLNDITIATPVFKGGRAVALFANCCHALDIGGRGLSADSWSVFEEGIFIPVMKLYEAGRPVEPLLEMIRVNVRTPDEVMGDIHSQIIANDVGARQLLAFLDEFDLPDIEALSDEIISRSERAMRERIAALPDGRHEGLITIDGYDAPIEIRAEVRIAGDELTVDFAGTSPAIERGINVALNYTRGYTIYGVKCAISPDVPNNAGSFEPVHVEAPEGCILNAQYPAAVAGRHLVGHFLPSAVMLALAGALPDKVIAPGADALWDTHIAGEGPDGRYFSFTWFSCGGTGALARKDGLSATAFPSGIAGVPVEVIETLSPIVVHRRELRPDSGGAGRHRGGLGQTMEFGVRTRRPYQFAGLYERIDHPPPPLAGGEPGAAGRLSTNTNVPLRAKETTMLPPDTVVTIEIPGGGGYGPPFERDPALVLADVRGGYVSEAAARERYGVAIDTASWRVDAEATQALRARGGGGA
jgi:N-methylhydantoinase B